MTRYRTVYLWIERQALGNTLWEWRHPESSAWCLQLVQYVTCRPPAQVQRERAAAERAAGGSHLAHQTQRLSEEEPRSIATAARKVSFVSVYLCFCIFTWMHPSVSSSLCLCQDGVSVGGETAGDRFAPVGSAAEERWHRRLVWHQHQSACKVTS